MIEAAGVFACKCACVRACVFVVYARGPVHECVRVSVLACVSIVSVNMCECVCVVRVGVTNDYEWCVLRDAQCMVRSAWCVVRGAWC